MDRKKFIKETWLDFPVLETDRLVLRQINMDINDAKDLFNNLYNDDDVIKYDWRKVDSIGVCHQTKLDFLIESI